jgi:hypothetical protein
MHIYSIIESCSETEQSVHIKRISMKIMQCYLVVAMLVNLSGSNALGCDQVGNILYDDLRSTFYHPNTCCRLFKLSPAIVATLGGGITSAVVFANYSTETTYLFPITFVSGAASGFVLGLGVTYVATKMYDSCVLRLQRRQNSDSEVV